MRTLWPPVLTVFMLGLLMMPINANAEAVPRDTVLFGDVQNNTAPTVIIIIDTDTDTGHVLRAKVLQREAGVVFRVIEPTKCTQTTASTYSVVVSPLAIEILPRIDPDTDTKVMKARATMSRLDRRLWRLDYGYRSSEAMRAVDYQRKMRDVEGHDLRLMPRLRALNMMRT